MNHTIIVNWHEKAFGCRKTCSYCNWRKSPYLPHGTQSIEMIRDFIRGCKKSFITISGGAEPLYKFEENHTKLFELADLIKKEGFKARVITREVSHVSKLKGSVDIVSISLDREVMDEIPKYRHEWSGMEVEYSLVLPPLPTSYIVDLQDQYKALQKKLGGRLILRENLNSIFYLNFDELRTYNKNIVYVKRALCRNSMYFTDKPMHGSTLVSDRRNIYGYLAVNPYSYLFGGIVKHYISPFNHMDYKDIDVIITDELVLDTLKRMFNYQLLKVHSNQAYPKYMIGSNGDIDLHIVLLSSRDDVERFVFNGQYDIDRIYLHEGDLHSDMDINSLKENIKKKVAYEVPSVRTGLFHPSREMIEKRHRAKLLRKGYVIKHG